MFKPETVIASTFKKAEYCSKNFNFIFKAITYTTSRLQPKQVETFKIFTIHFRKNRELSFLDNNFRYMM